MYLSVRNIQETSEAGITDFLRNTEAQAGAYVSYKKETCTSLAKYQHTLSGKNSIFKNVSSGKNSSAKK